MQSFFYLSTDIMGAKIKTSQGENVGVVQDFMVDPRRDMIIYIVLCYGNFFGKRHRHYAIPSRMLTVTYGDKASIALNLEIDQHELLNAPVIQANAWSLDPLQIDPHYIYELLPAEPTPADTNIEFAATLSTN